MCTHTCNLLRLQRYTFSFTLPNNLLLFLAFTLVHLFAQELSCVAFLALRHFFRRAAADEPSTCFAAFGTEVDDVVRILDDFKVVLYDDDGVAAMDEGIEGKEQLAE